jgi:hypothetical protein
VSGKLIRCIDSGRLLRGCCATVHEYSSINHPCFLDPSVAVWHPSTFYAEGTIVYRPYSSFGTYYYDQTDAIYECKIDHTSSAGTYPTTPSSYWTYLGEISPVQAPWNSAWNVWMIWWHGMSRCIIKW